MIYSIRPLSPLVKGVAIDGRDGEPRNGRRESARNGIVPRAGEAIERRIQDSEEE